MNLSLRLSKKIILRLFLDASVRCLFILKTFTEDWINYQKTKNTNLVL